VLLPAQDLVRHLVPNPATFRAPVRVRRLALNRAGRLVLRPVMHQAVDLVPARVLVRVLVRVLDLVLVLAPPPVMAPTPVMVRVGLLWFCSCQWTEELQFGPPQPVGLVPE
jgi:hypothetical protein